MLLRHQSLQLYPQDLRIYDMPVREINLMDVVQRVFDKTVEIMPETSVNFANMMIDKAHELWTLRAKNAPKRKDGSPSIWGERYANTLKVNYITSKKGGTASVFADEGHPDYMFTEFVENGINTWSIKDALLSGKAARRNQALYGTVFVRVPFRYRVPGRTKETSSFAGIMPQDIYEQAKAGIRLGKESGKYAGLVKVTHTPHGQYMTFRTVSQKTQGWWYPHKPATPVFEEVKARVEKMMEGALLNFLQGFMKDIKKEGEKGV